MEMIYLDKPAGLEMSVGDVMFTQRAIRRLDHARPISDEHLEIVVNAASKAPSGGNVQPARLLVIRDREKIKAFGSLYHEAWWAKRYDAYGWTSQDDIPADSIYVMPSRLADEMVDTPVVILAFTEPSGVAESSVYPGVQNLLLAARALGIGSVLTTLHPKVMERVYAMFDIPPEMVFHCCIPLGYPRGNFGPTKRFPTAQTTYWDAWGSPPPWK